MATLSRTAFKAPLDNLSTHKMAFLTYTGPAAYVALGESFTPADIGWGSFDAVEVCGVAYNGSTAVRLVTYDATAQKLVWYVPNTGSEASGDLSAYSVRLIVYGHG